MCERADAANKIRKAAHGVRAAAVRAGTVAVSLPFDDQALDDRRDETSIVAGRPLRKAFHEMLDVPVPQRMTELLDKMDGAERRGASH